MRLNRVGGVSAVDVDGPGSGEELAGTDGFAGFFFGGIDVDATFTGFDDFAGFLVFFFFGGIRCICRIFFPRPRRVRWIRRRGNRVGWYRRFLLFCLCFRRD